MARRRGGRAPNVHWTGFNGASLAQSAGSVGVNIAAAAHGTETLLRTRGELLCWLDGTQAPGGATTVAVGMIVMPGGSATTVTSDPISNADAPWFWIEQFTLAYEEYVTDVIDSPTTSAIRRVIDSKAMRIIRSDQEIQMVVQQSTIGSAVNINTAVLGRFLTQE